MPRPGPSKYEIKNWCRDFATGISRADIAADYGVSEATVYRYTRDVFSGEKRDKLGKGLLDWFHANQDATNILMRLCFSQGYRAQDDTVILLAAADAARRDLMAQTGGVPPTLRAVLYYMMGNYGASKDVYRPLLVASGEMRKRGIWSRDYFSDALPDGTDVPADHTVSAALQWAMSALVKPSDAFVNAPFVLGVAVEARGGQEPLAGALRQQLGFDVPVFACGGMAAIPRTFNIETRMRAWAEQHGVEPVVLVITDYDPSGQVIANNLKEWLVDINVIHIGINPKLADQHDAFDASGIDDDEEKTNSTHRRSWMWEAAVKEYGDTEYQVEALDYATWATVIINQMVMLLGYNADDDQDDSIETMWATLKLNRRPFEVGDNLMAALHQVVMACNGDPKQVAKQLGLELPKQKPTLASLRKKRRS